MAARLADAHGHEAKGLRTMESGLKRFSTAPAQERARALSYRAELATRLGNDVLARSSLDAVLSLPLSEQERAELAVELVHLRELVS